eukprot:1161697-Pelagomonas_calceolata.AAC.9
MHTTPGVNPSTTLHCPPFRGSTQASAHGLGLILHLYFFTTLPSDPAFHGLPFTAFTSSSTHKRKRKSYTTVPAYKGSLVEA